MRKQRRVLIGVLLALTATLAGGLLALPGIIEARQNTFVPDGLIPVGVVARALHGTLLVADLHDDLLLWNRDPLERSARGHSDVPRLLEGRTAVQVFSAVTKTPRGMNYAANTGDSDNITLLALVQRWPIATWRSRTERALHQARRLHDAARRSRGMLSVLTTAAELDALLRRPNAGSSALGGVLAIEGLHALDGEPANLDALFAAGYRMMGLTHFFDNEVAASAHGVSKGGLSELGRQLVRRMQALNVIVDVAHLAPAAVDDVLRLATRPVVVSHTGVQATCPGPRNLSDDQIRRIAANGGLIGIGYWDGAVCEASARAAARAIRHVATLVGVEHAALGSDYNGATAVAFDASRLVQMTQALLDEGFSAAEVRAIMGDNAIRFLRAGLPRSPNDATPGP